MGRKEKNKPPQKTDSTAGPKDEKNKAGQNDSSKKGEIPDSRSVAEKRIKEIFSEETESYKTGKFGKESAEYSASEPFVAEPPGTLSSTDREKERGGQDENEGDLRTEQSQKIDLKEEPPKAKPDRGAQVAEEQKHESRTEHEGRIDEEHEPHPSGDEKIKEITDLKIDALVGWFMGIVSAKAWQDLGLIASPGSIVVKDLGEAQKAIDTLEALYTVLKGSLEEAEKKEIENLITNLRLNYVSQRKKPV